MMNFGTLPKAAAILAAGLVAVAATAQPGAQRAAQGPAMQPAPAGPRLDIPQDVNFVGSPQNRNVARATAIVNEEIITRSDIDQRLALLMVGQKAQLPENELEAARAQILRTLIDEALQIPGGPRARHQDREPRHRRGIRQDRQRNGQNARDFAKFLTSIGSSERSLRRQILGEIAWDSLLQRITRVSVTDEEVKETLERLNASRGSREYRVVEIFLRSTPGAEAQTRAEAERAVQQIRAGAPFAAVARQISDATTAALGGDLGWTRLEQLPPELASVVHRDAGRRDQRALPGRGRLFHRRPTGFPPGADGRSARCAAQPDADDHRAALRYHRAAGAPARRAAGPRHPGDGRMRSRGPKPPRRSGPS
jgi:peptidyl-prolyl cis-trans isomerase SurA